MSNDAYEQWTNGVSSSSSSALSFLCFLSFFLSFFIWESLLQLDLGFILKTWWSPTWLTELIQVFWCNQQRCYRRLWKIDNRTVKHSPSSVWSPLPLLRYQQPCQLDARSGSLSAENHLSWSKSKTMDALNCSFNINQRIVTNHIKSFRRRKL